MADVLISVVIPTYNYAKTLPRAVESVIAQLDHQSELIIIDDGSTDETSDVIEALTSTHPFSFRALRQENAGPAAVRNKGLDEAKGSYLIFLDADDELVPGALQSLEQHIAKNPGARLVIAEHISVHPSGRESLHSVAPLPGAPLAKVKAYLLDKVLAISNGACAMHRDIFKFGRYPEAFRSSEDIPVFAQALANYPCSVLDSPMARIYKHDDSLRHNLNYSVEVGVSLVNEVFQSGRLPVSMRSLEKPFIVQRYLSLFRTSLSAGDKKRAHDFYILALKSDWRAVFYWSYTRKALKLWLAL